MINAKPPGRQGATGQSFGQITASRQPDSVRACENSRRKNNGSFIRPRIFASAEGAAGLPGWAHDFSAPLRLCASALKILSCAIALIAMVGCVDVSVKTTVRPGGDGVQRWSFSTTALMASELKKQIQGDPFFQRGRTVSDDFKEGDYLLTVDVPFNSVGALKQTGHEIRVDESGIFRTTMTYRESWTPAILHGKGMLGERAGGVFPVVVKVAVELPGKITESNAEHVEGSVAHWTVPLTDLVEARTLEVRSVYWNVWLIGGLGGVFVVSLAALILLVAMASRRAARRADEGALK